MAPGDIGIAGTLCALASLSRAAIKSQLLENDSFSIYIEYEPHVRELVEAYMASKFSTVLDLLERHSVGSVILTLGQNAYPSVDETYRRCSFRPARQEPYRPNQESRPGSVLPAFLVD